MLLTAAVAGSIPAAAVAQKRAVSLPAASLAVSLTRLAAEAGIDIVSTEPGLARLPAPALSGRLTPRQALDRLLKGSGYRYLTIDARSFRIVRAPAPHPAPPPIDGAASPPAQPPPADIIVTASKQQTPLQLYPGSLTVIVPPAAGIGAAPGDLTDAARVTPVLQSTEFGPGRDKIFIRGIADSSFDGAAQSTASVYLGDTQLSYSGADPSLRLYDVADVQVMEGPQGTLYGSGSIGGIIRIEPAAPVLDRVAGQVAGGVTLTDGGAPGGDAGAMLNLPVVDGRAAVRGVAYRVRDGGYITDLGALPGQVARTDTNSVDTVGGRLAGRVQPGDGWRIDLTGLYQRIDAADAQYADRAVGPLAHRSALAQPYDNEILLGSGTVEKSWDSGLRLLTVAGIASTHAHDLFDATPPRSAGDPAATPVAYAVDDAKLLLSGETRLSRTLSRGQGWVVGFTLLSNRDAENRSLGPVAAPADIIGVTNVTRSASVFAEGTVALAQGFLLTGGARVTIARTDGEPSFHPRASDFVAGRLTRRIDPTLAFAWEVAPRLTAFGRAQTGYRTGGLAVARGVGRVADFESDSIRVGELGLRWLRRGATGLSVTTAVSLARWTAIQADLVNRRGSPYTANIGDASVEAFEGTIDWVPVRGLRAAASFLQTSNRTSGPLADSASPAHRRLPDTPPFAGAGTIDYRWAAGPRDTLTVGGSIQRVGRSVLGTGDLLAISQGRITTLGANAAWRRGRYELSLAAANLTDVRGNLFASGNPFELANRSLVTPLRPRSLRLGGRVDW